MFRVSITGRAEKDLKRLERKTKNRIVTVIAGLADEPRPSGCRKIQSEAGVWRIRVGEWRVGYVIDAPNYEVTVIRIAHRREFYD